MKTLHLSVVNSRLLLLGLFSLLYLVGCGAQGPRESNSTGLGHSLDALGGDNGMDPNGLDGNGMDGNGMDGNGLDPNGLDPNGLDANGLDPNGLDPNGLAPDGISTGAQAAWKFNMWFLNGLNPPCLSAPTPCTSYANSDKIMAYVAKCALPEGQSLTFTIKGVTYSYPGSLGLAPVWSSRQPIPVNEQELISACLAAHINALGEHIMVSFSGGNGALSVSPDEAFTYYAMEGYFFGNIFAHTPVYMVRADMWTPRGCTGTVCNPLTLPGGGTTCGGGSFASCTVPNDPHGIYHNVILTRVTPDYASAHNPAGSVEILVNGLPTGVSAPLAVTGTTNRSWLVNIHKFATLPLGAYTMTASNVVSGGVTYVPTVTVGSNLVGNAWVPAPSSSASLTLNPNTYNLLTITYAVPPPALDPTATGAANAPPPATP